MGYAVRDLSAAVVMVSAQAVLRLALATEDCRRVWGAEVRPAHCVAADCPTRVERGSAPATCGTARAPAACPMHSVAGIDLTGDGRGFAPAEVSPTGVATAFVLAIRGVVSDQLDCPMGSVVAILRTELGKACDRMGCGTAWPMVSGLTSCVVPEHPTV